MRGVQNQYQKRLKMNTNRDTFTTYQRLSQQDHSPLRDRQRMDSEHNRIESLKCTLKSLSQQASIDLSKATASEPSLAVQEQTQNKKYNIKLDQLFRNLQEIAAKDYFSPANANSHSQMRPRSSTFNYPQSHTLHLEVLQHSQKLSYEALKTDHPRHPNNNGLFAPSKSQSFTRKEDSLNHSKNTSQNKSMHEQSKGSASGNPQDSLWTGKGEFKSNSKKTFSKRDVVNEFSHNSKNLSKIFQRLEDSVGDMPRVRDRADTQLRQNQFIFNQRIHRGKITSILIGNHIYTSSLDYTLKKTAQSHDGDFASQIIDQFRGGVEHVSFLGGKIFAVGRDCYLRSSEGNFHHKFSTCPVKVLECDRNTQAVIGFLNGQIQLFDLQKRVNVSSLLGQRGSQLMSKWSKQLFVGDHSGLVSVDWRKREQVVPLYHCHDPSNKTWMSMPFDKHFAYRQDRDITLLTEKITKNATFKLPPSETFTAYDWTRSGLNILTVLEGTGAAKLTRIRGERDRDELDVEANGSNLGLVVVREKQIIYGGKDGELIIKRTKK